LLPRASLAYTGCELMVSEGLVHRISGPLGRVNRLSIDSALKAQPTYKRDDMGSFFVQLVAGSVGLMSSS
jgi:hypothetical protein